MPSMRDVGKRLLKAVGYEVRAMQPPGGLNRRIGELESVLADIWVRGFRPSVVFDIGAADGTWTAAVRPIFPDARFVLVEPRHTSIEPTVRAGVGAREGTATLTDWGVGSTLLAVDSPDARQYQVAVTTLDCLAEQFGMPDLVKLDVEGFELEALRGASTLFGRTDVFVIEVAMYRFSERPILHEVVAFMAERGYFVYDIAGFIRRPFDGAVGLMDLCFARLLRGPEREWHAPTRK